jgi:DNA-binding transcriptional ArsR family regulator
MPEPPTRPLPPLDDSAADAVFRALADSTRRDIVRRTLTGEQSISTLAERYDMSFAAVQKHIAVLDRCGLVAKRRRGKEQLVGARIETVERASHLLGEFEQLWRERLGRIDALLASDIGAEPGVTAPRPNRERTTSS